MAALVHHIAALGHRHDHVEVLLDEQDGGAELLVDLQHDPRDILDDGGLNAFRWLVEQQEIRVADQRSSDRELLLLSAAHGAGGLALRSARIGK